MKRPYPLRHRDGLHQLQRSIHPIPPSVRDDLRRFSGRPESNSPYRRSGRGPRRAHGEHHHTAHRRLDLGLAKKLSSSRSVAASLAKAAARCAAFEEMQHLKAHVGAEWQSEAGPECDIQGCTMAPYQPGLLPKTPAVRHAAKPHSFSRTERLSSMMRSRPVSRGALLMYWVCRPPRAQSERDDNRASSSSGCDQTVPLAPGTFSVIAPIGCARPAGRKPTSSTRAGGAAPIVAGRM